MLTEPVTCSTCGAVSVNGGTIHCNTCFERAQLGIGEGTTRPHGSPEQCPTYYDGCNCTVEVLVHNIERAEKAEARVAELEEENAIAQRIIRGEYLDWDKAGGSDECKHGIANAIPCERCDLEAWDRLHPSEPEPTVDNRSI